MRCCSRCSTVTHRTYGVEGDGDGIEYLVEIAYRADGETENTSVVLTH